MCLTPGTMLFWKNFTFPILIFTIFLPAFSVGSKQYLSSINWLEPGLLTVNVTEKLRTILEELNNHA